MRLSDGTTLDGSVGGGLWLVWLDPAALPVAVEALDASGALVGRIEDAAGVQPKP